ncbi:probable maltase isoform X2 [Contarinia nasturtii]|uniref:probable maltase isoform X2 n=1 Tax=Contarinia nasturtii TaxID=265458 RepID=UPI0012D39F0B|nr:probable maltase isoform X2 [Contarinia nasturtii]
MSFLIRVVIVSLAICINITKKSIENKTSISVSNKVLLCKCVKNKGEEWWEYGHFYHVYVRSFKDSNGDGIGDLNGLTSRLPYLKDIGVDGVLLSPINSSPLKDFGYDVLNYLEIHSDYGTLEDFLKLVKRCKELDLKLIMDFIPNHTSDQHEWFKKSSRNNSKYKDYYIWHEGKRLPNGTRVEPSNWRSVFGGSAWTWVESRQQYYLHQFLPEQPDLNFRNEAVVKEMEEVMRFWLRKGAAGFRVDAVGYLMESKPNKKGYYDDEPSFDIQNPFNNPGLNLNQNGHEGLRHIHTKNLDESYDLVYRFHDVVKETQFASFPRILMTEDYTDRIEDTLKYFGKIRWGKISRNGAEVPFIFNTIQDARRSSSAGFFNKAINNCMGHINSYAKEDKIHPNWMLGNHDGQRVSTRFGENRTDLFNILIKTLPGISLTYYGEEIGMTDVRISEEDKVDLNSRNRDTCRTPMHWDGNTNAGFSTLSKARKTWLPIALNYEQVNVEVQESQPRSHLNVFKKLSELRKNPTLKYGELTIEKDGKNVLAYKRQIDGEGDIVAVVLNFGSKLEFLNAKRLLHELPDQMEAFVSSIHFHIEGNVDTRKLQIPPYAGLVLIKKTDVKSKSHRSTPASTSKSKSWFS